MDNVALDVIIGLVFIYLLFSILLTGLAELILNHGQGLRGKNLEMAIKSAFGASGESKSDTGADELVKRFFSQGLIESLREGARKPSEIPADMFSKAYLAVLGGYSGPADRPATPAEFINKLKRNSNLPNHEKIVSALDQLLPGAETSWDAYERHVANWFGQIGDRSIGWYKRKIDRRMLFLAFAVAFLANIDTLFIMRMLQLDQQHRQLLASQAASVVTSAEGKPTMPLVASKSSAVQRMERRDQVDAALVAAIVSLRNSILDSERLRTALHARCPQPSDPACQFDPYLWYDDLEKARRDSWAALTPKPRNDPEPGRNGRTAPAVEPKAEGGDRSSEEASIGKLADDLRALSAKVYFAYPDPTRREDAELRKHLNALRPSIDLAALRLQQQLDADADMAADVRRVCAEKPAGKKARCVELFELAATGRLGFPIGWSPDLREFQKQLADEWITPELGPFWLSAEGFLGLVLTALALMLGAPFWFDVLRRVVALRTAGPRRDDGLTAGPPPAAQGDGTRQASPQPGSPLPAGGGWFSDAVNDVERRLSAEQIRVLQGRLEVSPISGRIDATTRTKIYEWRQRHRGDPEPSWELDEPMVRELLWESPDPLLRDRSVLPSTTVLPASDGPMADLKLGNSGPEVARLRGLLAAKGFLVGASVSSSETFDADLDRAVKEFQTTHGLSLDGVVGPLTWLKLSNDPDKLPPAFSSPGWMRYAIHEIGITELAGAGKSNPRIEEYQEAVNATPDDEIAWCSSFANWVLKRAGVAPTDSAVASSWREWGVDTVARYGAVIVLLQAGRPTPPKDGAGAHVGFLIRETADRYLVLGGNQGREGAGCVCVTAFPKTGWQCLALRWPKEEVVSRGEQDSEVATGDDRVIPVTPSRFVAESLSEPTLEYGSSDVSAVARLQALLNAFGKAIAVDGIFGVETRKAIIELQKAKGLPVTGVADAATWHYLLLVATGTPPPQKLPLSQVDIGRVITKHSLDVKLVQLVQAVLRVESSGRGFVDGHPVVRLEGHILWRYAEKLGIDPKEWAVNGSGLLHQERTNRFVLKGGEEWKRLQKARGLCKKMLSTSVPPNKLGVTKPEQLADLATSWGLFQIMGFNWEHCDAKDLATFVNDMETSEAKQLELFLFFLQKVGALDALQKKNWAEFARIYNGKDYRTNAYDIKLERAYEELSRA